ncbi:MAG: alpha/beta fold hydrolase [Symploca sp. SIO2E9]|nr:alpha/beta fold hydrolase [Symploca sp. SIO2E9]
MADYIYLHGFASSPQSAKAQKLHSYLQTYQIELIIPDLNQGDFSHLTLTRQLQQVEAQFPPAPTPVVLIGSSFGGLTAAFLAQRHSQVQQLVLLAPAFGFSQHWLTEFSAAQLQEWQTSGYLSVYHYGEKRTIPLHYQFIQDFLQYQEKHLQRPLPTLILHGKQDQTIPITASLNYASERPWVQLVELDSDHSLSDVMPEIWDATRAFCNLF